jgi:diguanylate cyclase (GGDEF)-like protein
VSAELCILIVDDNPDDRVLIARSLRRGLGQLDLIEAVDAATFRTALEAGVHDITLTDFQLRWTDGLTVLRAIKERDPHHPVIMFTGTGNEEVAVAGMKEGLDDYVVKSSSHYARLPAAVRGALASSRQRVAENTASQALRDLAHAGTHDGLTDLPNRTLFDDRLKLAIARKRRSQVPLAVLFLDVDRFKVVNDSLGHPAGDELLRTLAGRLQKSMRPGDTVARFSGDEFVILCEGLAELHDLIRVADRILEAVASPVSVARRQMRVTGSIGIAVAATGNDDGDALIRDADAAMYQAKRQGGARFNLFDDEMRAQSVALLEAEQALRHVVANGGMRVAYQPIVRVADQRPVGVEALARLSTSGGVTAGAEFIPLAEEIGLIGIIGKQVLQQACRKAAEMRKARADPPLRLFVNISAAELESPGLVDHTASVLKSSRLEPSALVLEMTETTLMAKVDRILVTLESLKSLGVGLAIDDFGTGYSSLAYLPRFPVDLLKIDRSFVASLGAAPADRAMVSAIVSLATALGIEVVAEGVETPAQLAALQEIGCDLAQGYLFSPPLASSDVIPVVSNDRGLLQRGARPALGRGSARSARRAKR